MSTLEQIVLPLAESRALVEAGIVLDTAMVSFHYGNTEHWGLVTREDAMQYARMNSDNDIPRPVFSELLDAIRAKTAVNAEFSFAKYRIDGKIGTGLTVDWGETGHSQALRRSTATPAGNSDLLAAAALLMEVSR